MQVDGVDAFMVGPYDLSGSIGYPGSFEHPDMCFALKRIMDVSKKLNKVAGFHVIPPDAEAMNKKIQEGYRFIGFSLDTLFLGVKCREEMKKLKAER